MLHSLRVLLVLLLIQLQSSFESTKGSSVDDGEWAVDFSMGDEGECNIEIRDVNSITYTEFIKEYAYTKPVILRGLTDNSNFRFLCSKSNLLKEYGEKTVRLSTANTHSYNKGFGVYTHFIKNTTSATGPGTGVPFHWHGPGFSEVIYGRKRWFLYPPDQAPEFQPNHTTLSWVSFSYPNLELHQMPVECTIRPGEVLYFPDRWWHATLNLDTSVFISTFLG
ncbi:jmjC domain-containing protein 8 isoform X3 [Triplophysa rosa]|uniref:jmjC domain-containing protein 8 isoform X3 n=1 Tax=Triplophysa rosa TaxID=992332 RepID=UPI00254605E9|nr:jmjC domain-containing protein 8 isoform X3 [Triplophysa rosa]